MAMRNSLYILGPLSDGDIEWMLAFGERQVVARGDVLIRQGQPVECLFLTLKGVFRVTDERGGGLERARFGSGEILGEMTFIDSSPASTTVTAVGDGLVLALPHTLLRQHLSQDTAFAARLFFALALVLSDRLRATESRARGSSAGFTLNEDQTEDGELDLKVLDNVHLAGARFRYILGRLTQS